MADYWSSHTGEEVDAAVDTIAAQAGELNEYKIKLDETVNSIGDIQTALDTILNGSSSSGI